jgi:hypothetical protein
MAIKALFSLVSGMVPPVSPAPPAGFVIFHLILNFHFPFATMNVSVYYSRFFPLFQGEKMQIHVEPERRTLYVQK